MDELEKKIEEAAEYHQRGLYDDLDMLEITPKLYTEEEVAELLHKFDRDSGGPDKWYTSQWFEQNKKK